MTKTKIGKKLGVAFAALALAFAILFGGAVASNASSHQAASGHNSVQLADGGTVPPPVTG